jgi:PKD repeat protein
MPSFSTFLLPRLITGGSACRRWAFSGQWLLSFFLGLGLAILPIQAQPNYDVVVYGGTAAGVTAAVAAASHGHSVVLLSLNSHVGGMVSGGINYTDMGNRAYDGGLANVFFTDIVNYYTTTYGVNSPQVIACKSSGQKFEDYVAELIFNKMLAAQNVTVVKNVRLDLTVPGSVKQNANGTITAITVQNVGTHDSETFAGKMFIDASYEGDLMAGSGTTYTYGRESISQYDENLAGVRVPGPVFGQADDLVMSYNYRPTITNLPGNTVPFPRPANYNPAPFLAQYSKSLQNGTLTHFINAFLSGTGSALTAVACPNAEYCTNDFDFAGSSLGYSDGTWAIRDQIAQNLEDYEESAFYFLQHDTASLSPAFFIDAQKWGFPRDEFTETGGFPFQLYVREARRMVGPYVLTQADITQNRYKTNGVCSASYGLDCHIIQYLTENGVTYLDTTPSLGLPAFDIPYPCLTPSTATGQPGNLLVPVCLSSTHVAFDAVRTEPVYMMLGQAAGDAAHLALANATTVQQVNVTNLRALLQADGAVLDCGYLPPVTFSFTPAHPAVGQTVQFNAGTTSTPKRGITNYWWDFEGNGTLASQIHSPTYVFTQNKTYNVSLVVQDGGGMRALVTVPVPVGTATGQDVTIDDYDESVSYSGSWSAGYPVINRNPALIEVFTGPGTHYSNTGKTAPAQATYKPVNLTPGRYSIAFGYRPDKTQTTSALVSINTSSGTTQMRINEQTVGTSALPFIPLGTYRFSGNGAETVTVSTSSLPTQRVATDAIRWVWEGN